MSIKKQAGFTLMELIIVIVIIGVLSSGIVATYVDLKPQAAEASALKLQNTIRSLYIPVFVAKNGHLPTAGDIKTYVTDHSTTGSGHIDLKPASFGYTFQLGGIDYNMELLSESDNPNVCGSKLVNPTADPSTGIQCVFVYKSTLGFAS